MMVSKIPQPKAPKIPPVAPKKASGKFRSLLAVCLIGAAAIHLLGLLIFGTYTLFKGSVPRMPFTSEGGVAVEDAGLEAPPAEEAPDPSDESAMESTPSSMPTETPSEEDTVLAVVGLSSSLPVASAPPTLAAPSSIPGGTGQKSFSASGGRGGGKASAVNFFGVKGEGTNVYFVVDLSDSMLEEQRGGVPGFSVVKKQLKQMIQSLDEGTRFNVVTYGQAGADLFQAASVPASPDQKKAAVAFLDKYNNSIERKGTQFNNYRPGIPVFGLIQNDRGSDRWTTRMDLGLLAAVEGQADTIFLISDGKAPTLAEDRREEARAAMKDASLSDSDRAKYQKELEKWRRDYADFTEQLKAYRLKYKDLLAKRDEKIMEMKAKGEGKVREGKEVDYGVRILGLPDAPREPRQPEVPQAKSSGKVIKEAGDVYDEAGLIRRIREVIEEVYKRSNAPLPSIHTVGYMSKSAEAKFLQTLAAKNNGFYKSVSSPIQDRAPQP